VATIRQVAHRHDRPRNDGLVSLVCSVSGAFELDVSQLVTKGNDLVDLVGSQRHATRLRGRFAKPEPSPNVFSLDIDRKPQREPQLAHDPAG
jgi:hypothetical protein